MSDAIKTNDEVLRGGQSKKPLVFISHDTRDAKLAEEFSKLLSSVSAGVLKSFRSSDNKGKQGIEYGVDWYPEIMKQLNQATDVVCLLTQHSLDRPWLLYEAGVAKGRLDTQVLGLALGIPFQNVNNGPFSQFQNCAYDVDSITKLVMQLLGRIPDAEPDEDTVKGSVEKFVEHINKLMNIEEDEYLSEASSSAKLFEEIKEMYQDLPGRISQSVINEKRRNFRHIFHPEMLRGLMRFSKDKRVAMLMVLSLFKEDFPWIYEAGRDILDTPADDRESIKYKRDAFKRLIEMTFHGPMMEMFDMKGMMRYGKEAEMFFMEFLERVTDVPDNEDEIMMRKGDKRRNA